MGVKHIFSTVLILIATSALSFSQNFTLDIQGDSDDDSQYIRTLTDSIEVSSKRQVSFFISTLNSRLQAQGYLDAQFLVDTTAANMAKVKVKLGSQIHEVKLLKPSNEGQLDYCRQVLRCETDSVVIAFSHIPNYLRDLTQQLSEQGQPFAKVQLTNIQRRSDKGLHAALSVVSSNSRKLDALVVKGYDNFPQSFLKYYANLKIGQTANPEELNKRVNRLNQLGFAEVVKAPAILFAEEKTSLYIYVSKNKANRFEGFLGFGNSDDNNKTGIFGEIDLMLINNLNYGEVMQFRYLNQANGQTEFNFNMTLPYLAGSPMSLALGLHIFRKDSLFQNSSQTVGLKYQRHPNWQYQLSWETNQSAKIEENNDGIENFNGHFWGVGVQFQKVSSSVATLISPSKFAIEVNLGRRQAESSALKQSSLALFGQYEFVLDRRHSIFTNIQSSYLFSDQYLENELLRTGGIETLRGFNENSISTSGFALLRSEYRYKLDASTYIHSVIDLALMNSLLSSKTNKLSGIGLGLARKQFSGLFKLQMVVGQTNRQPYKLSDSKLHLSFTTNF